ncbi:hypothetical protein JOQ06_012734 [Pogonophryne albipinna]|uniref:Uncharacterized protein n=1 Tax=Pogonophryne albipinna TaxID=1090488 RepID=A0AAD6BI99_9TELE|nr:hypothetical protein JOQ06_012734 [Pogonophryne albipinna]
MASTTQSALEYVRGARAHLVKTLKNLSVILENLNQQGVLRDEEVSRIQAEGNDYDKNRTLLDSVTKKGEAASYEFLKIIYITRKRTHGRTTLLPESKTFDLHYWISCFPFKEDTEMGNNYLTETPTPCHRYQAKLKSKAQKISKEFWTAKKYLFEENSKPDLSYMSLVLDTQGSVSPSKIKKCKNKKSKMTRCKKLGTYIPKDKADMSPSDLLKTDKNILLVGKSGIGKTALTHEMLKLWTGKDDKELNYMFYFDMRKISNIKSLEDLLFNEFSEPDEGNDEVLLDIKNNSDNVTLIFDGITDLSSPVVRNLVKKDLLKDSKVVVTCRPADEDHLLSEDFLRVEQCVTEEKKHMKHLIPYMCRLLTEKSPSLMQYLIPAEELKNTSNWFFKAVITTFRPSLCGNDDPDTEDSGRILFLCQCLYESQCPEACIDLLEQLDFHLDLREESLDPYPCCAVAYVITQSKERKIWLNLEDVTMSQQGMRPLLGCLPNVQWCDSLPRQLWEIFLLSEGEMDYITLLGLDGNQLHLPVEGGRKLFGRAGTVLQKISKKVKICLHWEREDPDCHSLCETLLEALPYVSSLSFRRTYRVPGLQDQERCYETLKRQEKQLFLDLCLRAANHIQGESVHNESAPAVWTIDLSERKSSILLEVLRLQPEKKQVELRGCSEEESESVLQSAPAVWTIDLSERKTSILLEVLRLQPEKTQVELRGCSEEESEVRTLLQCLPHISQLSCGPEFFQRVCTLISVRPREEAERLASLLQLSGFTLLLSGELPRNTCLSVGRVLQLCGSNVDLILKPRKMSVKGAFALFRRTTQLHSLKLSNDMALLLGGWVRRWGVGCQVTVEELSLSPQTAQPSHRVLLKVVSSLASLLRYWAVRQLDLTEVCVPALGLIPLLLHDGPLNIKLSEKNVQQLLSLLHELQDQDLTWSFLGGDLTSFSLNWELLHLLLQHPSAQTLTVNMRKNLFLQENITRLLPYLDRIVFERPCPSFVLTAIREIYRARASSIIPSLLRSLDQVINLTCREMSPMDCVALLYTLAHSDGVKLNLLWASIPAWKIESILLNLDNVSQLSVDRNLLLRLVHGCAASGAQQGAAEALLRTVQHRLDLSCSSCVELPEEDQRDTLRLTAEDCRAVSIILRRSRRDTQLILQDCEVQDSGLDLLFPVLHKVQLRASTAVLLQLVSLVPVNSERDTVGRAVSLCKALEGELDLSHSSLDQRACAALALMLDSSEELSHCQLTDQLLLTLSAQLHKVQVLEQSYGHNNITDASTDLLLQLVSINPSIHTVRLFENNIVNRTSFEIDNKFEIW